MGVIVLSGPAVKRLGLLLAGVILLLASCSKAPPPSPPETVTLPTLAPAAPGESPTEDSAYLALNRNVVSTIDGVVEEKLGSFTLKGAAPVPVTKDRQDLLYSEWSIRVDRYLVSPFPYKRIKVWCREGWVYKRHVPTGPSQCRLFPGEGAILFLTKQTHERLPLQEDQFWLLTMVPISDGKVRIIRGGQSAVEPVEDFVFRLRLLAQKAGRTILTEDEKAEAIGTVLNYPRVKEELEGRECEVGEVLLLPDEQPAYWVTIYLGGRELPGVTIRVKVDLSQKQVCCLSRELRPRVLTQEERDRLLEIALSDPEVLEWIGDKGYEVTRIEESSWTESYQDKESFHVFPAVEMGIPPDKHVPGVILKVFVDLEANKVAKVFSHPRKSLPLPPTTPTSGS